MFKYKSSLLTPITRSRRFPRPISLFLGASGVVCCLFTAQTIYLDSQPWTDGTHPTSSLKRRKSTNSFDLSQPIDIERSLREHEESHITNKTTGVSRFDVVQVS